MGDSDREMVEPSNVVISSASVASSSSEKCDQELIIYQSWSITQAPGLATVNSSILTPQWSYDQTTSYSQDTHQNEIYLLHQINAALSLFSDAQQHTLNQVRVINFLNNFFIDC